MKNQKEEQRQLSLFLFLISEPRRRAFTWLHLVLMARKVQLDKDKKGRRPALLGAFLFAGSRHIDIIQLNAFLFQLSQAVGVFFVADRNNMVNFLQLAENIQP